MRAQMWFGRTSRNTLVAFSVAAVMLAATPAPSLAAAYPVTAVYSQDYAMVGPSVADQERLADAGCTVLGLFNEVIGLACDVGRQLWTPTQDQSGWWRDQVWQTSQAFVHLGAICNQSKSSCTYYKWDIYQKTRTNLDAGCFQYLFRYGPALYGSWQVYVCPRWPYETWGEVYKVLTGNGL